MLYLLKTTITKITFVLGFSVLYHPAHEKYDHNQNSVKQYNTYSEEMLEKTKIYNFKDS